MRRGSAFILAITEIFSCVTSREESEVKIGMEIEGLKEATDAEIPFDKDLIVSGSVNKTC